MSQFQAPMTPEQFINATGPTGRVEPVQQPPKVVETPQAAVKALLSHENCEAVLKEMEEKQGTGVNKIEYNAQIPQQRIRAENIRSTALWTEYMDTYSAYDIRLQGSRAAGCFTIIIALKQS